MPTTTASSHLSIARMPSGNIRIPPQYVADLSLNKLTARLTPANHSTRLQANLVTPMPQTRREFVSAAAAGFALPAFAAQSYHLRAGPAEARISATGELAELRYQRVLLTGPNPADSLPQLTVAGVTLRCLRPVHTRRSARAVTFDYRIGDSLPLEVSYTIELRALPDRSVLLVQQIAWKSPRRYSEPIALTLPRNVLLPGDNRSSLAPARNGVARRLPLEHRGTDFLYRMAGGDSGSEAQRLAIPLLGETSASHSLRLAISSDAGFSSVLQLAGTAAPGRFSWTHTVGGDAGESVQRTFYTLIHTGSDRRTFHAIYDTALSSVPPGPDWLHHIAMVDYDYLSKGGAGWFADIDALSALLKPAERSRVALTIHGWYDYVGRYAFNPATKALDRKWVAFPNVKHPQFVAHATGPNSRTATYWGWRKIFDRLRPVDMSIADLRRRMQYARSRGFRCLLYFGDGMNSGDELTGIHDPSKVLIPGGWIGPESAGRTYAQNPLHPAVRSFYRDYLNALLSEFGKDLDGFVWDETFHIKAGTIGTPHHPGYADAAMMSLVAELRHTVEAYDKNLAFLTSDNVGPSYETPYALMAHGTFQDSMCGQRYWPYGLFPNLRNTLWSCNWYHQTTWKRNEDAVNWYQIPLAISNGYGDDTGPADMTAAQTARMMALFQQLGQRRLTLSWIEEAAGHNTYNGKPVSMT